MILREDPANLRAELEQQLVRLTEGRWPASRRRADEITAALRIFGADEIRVIHAIFVRLATVELEMLADAPVHSDAIDALAGLVDRLLVGRRDYGELVLATDKRDFVREANEERVDVVVYNAMLALNLGTGDARSRLTYCLRSTEVAWSLCAVGQDVTAETLRYKLDQIRVKEAPKPADPPARWCIASGKYFTSGMHWIAAEAGAPREYWCHQCHACWPQGHEDLRDTSEGQVVVPMHEPVPITVAEQIETLRKRAGWYTARRRTVPLFLVGKMQDTKCSICGEDVVLTPGGGVIKHSGRTADGQHIERCEGSGKQPVRSFK